MHFRKGFNSRDNRQSQRVKVGTIVCDIAKDCRILLRLITKGGLSHHTLPFDEAKDIFPKATQFEKCILGRGALHRHNNQHLSIMSEEGRSMPVGISGSLRSWSGNHQVLVADEAFHLGQTIASGSGQELSAVDVQTNAVDYGTRREHDHERE